MKTYRWRGVISGSLSNVKNMREGDVFALKSPNDTITHFLRINNKWEELSIIKWNDNYQEIEYVKTKKEIEQEQIMKSRIKIKTKTKSFLEELKSI